MPPTVNGPRAVCMVTACSFGNGSVVMMASAASPPAPRASAGTRGTDTRRYLVDRQADADDAGGGDEDFLGTATEARRRLGGHAARVRHAVLTGTRIRAPAVHDEGPRASLRPVEVLARHEHGGRLHQVRGEQRRRRYHAVRGENRQVELLSGRLDADVPRR